MKEEYNSKEMNEFAKEMFNKMDIENKVEKEERDKIFEMYEKRQGDYMNKTMDTFDRIENQLVETHEKQAQTIEKMKNKFRDVEKMSVALYIKLKIIDILYLLEEKESKSSQKKKNKKQKRKG